MALNATVKGINVDSDFETLIDLPLGLDPDEITRSELDPVAAGVIDDKTIDLMSKENRVGIARGAPTALNSSAVPAWPVDRRHTAAVRAASPP